MTNSARRPLSAELCIGVVVPVYNETGVLAPLHERLATVLGETGCRYEVIFVDDGSTDGSGATLDDLARRDSNVRVVHLSRNFGQQAAVQAGLEFSTADAVIVMDADLQDDPASIGEFLHAWQEGYDVVYAVRVGRKEGPIKRLLFFSFYRLLAAMSRTPIPLDAGNFGLIDRRVVDSIARLPDRDRYFAGLRSWVGFRQLGVAVERGERYDGRPRVSVWQLFRTAKSALVSFSTAPLSVFYGIALVATLVFVGLSVFTLYHKLSTGLAIPGWTSQILVACFFGAINALGIAVLGEYVLRIYDQVRGRPIYLVDRTVNCADRQPSLETDLRAGRLPHAKHSDTA